MRARPQGRVRRVRARTRVGGTLRRSLTRAAASADFKSLGPAVLGFRTEAIGVERRLHLELQSPDACARGDSMSTGTGLNSAICARQSSARPGTFEWRRWSPRSGGHDRRSKAPMGPHWRAMRSECVPEASREGRRATADEQHRDWFTTCAPSSMDTPRDARLPANAPDRTPASAGEMRICGSRDESAADLHHLPRGGWLSLQHLKPCGTA